MTEEPRAIFSADGQAWSHDEGSGPVVKIVIGTPPRAGEEAKPVELSAGLRRDFDAHLPTATHLHLWQVKGVKKLPTLPAGLRCLDVRGCAELESLPELPGGLETLDLGGCTGLKELPSAPPKLERFFFDGCTGLEDLDLQIFLRSLAAAPLVEVDGSRSALTNLARMPRQALRKLVLAGCEKLASVDGLETFPALEHLNLSGCTALETLPKLPPRLGLSPKPGFLALHGAEKLETFMGQSIGPYDRGAKRQNVAAAFHTRRKFGHEPPAVMPHAKVLLMGDGRVGKSTLAKRLQWEETHAPNVKPDKGETFTHMVRFWPWMTGLSLPEKDAAALEERAAEAGVTLPKTKDGLLDGAVRLWDFGGQEIYHSTHRIFAGEGSIFLLVWRDWGDQGPEIGAPPEDVTPEEWREWNRQRPLDYWLDYIFSMRPEATVALVCTACKSPDTMKAKPDWKARAPKHDHRRLQAFWVDSLAEQCGQHRDYQRLVAWIREASGREAKRIGILQPKFFRQVSDLLVGWLEQNSRARHDNATPERQLLPWSRWEAEVTKAHGRSTDTLEPSDVAVITNYLHDAGHLFQIRHAAHRAVLVDQEWAASLIYQLLNCSGRLRRVVKGNGGWFSRAEIEADPLWKGLDGDIQRERLLAYMEECRVVTRLARAQDNRLGQDVFLASDKWLLPPYEQVKLLIEDRLERVYQRPGTAEQERFEFEDLELSERDFRSLQSVLARTFGTRAVYFRDGLQALGEKERWCFRVRWRPNAEDAFAGKVDAVLLAPRAELELFGAQIEDLFFSDDSPIKELRRMVKRSPAEKDDLTHGYFRGIRAAEYQVGVSSSGFDAEEAAALVAALEAAGLTVAHYKLKRCREGDRESAMEFMREGLGRPPCIVLLLSNGYLQSDDFERWQCAWEVLADAIHRLDDGRRSKAQTIAVYKDANWNRLHDVVVPLLKKMGRHFGDLYAGVPPEDRLSFDYYDGFSKHFYSAAGEKCRKFSEARGAQGSFLPLPTDVSAPGAFDAIVEAVRGALAAKEC